jgi:hypothetical protein
MNTPAPTPPNVSLWNGDLPFLKLDTLALDAGGLLIQSLLAAIAPPISCRATNQPASPAAIATLSVVVLPMTP